MTPEHLDLYRQLSETKIYKERFGRFDLNMKPPVFDCENTERCLWRMVDHDKWIVQTGDGYGNVDVYRQPFLGFHGEVDPPTFHDRLDIALIKVIIKQEGGE
jgi:hypothetical protein